MVHLRTPDTVRVRRSAACTASRREGGGTPMSLARGAAFSLGCAALGAAGWAAVCMATDMRLGFLAILVGGLAGFGMGLGNKARGGVGAGFLAGCVAALAIMGSRYGAIHFGVQNYLKEEAEMTPEKAVEAVGSEVEEDFMARGGEFEEEDEYYDAVAQ